MHTPDDIESVDDPIRLFTRWMKDAEAAEPGDANAMSVATADGAGRPSVRILLLKGVDALGFVFYTNITSRKGEDLVANPHAALCFHWKSLGRQVRVEGPIDRVSDSDADAYFASRARLSQIGAWASRQSQPLTSRAALMEAVARLEAEYKDRDIPRPPWWVGSRLTPQRVEFWSDGANRLHDRFLFTRDHNGGGGAEAWTVTRLSP